MKLGLLGGTFNPIHNGHLAIAAEVRQSLQLDRVLFIPAPEPPHKSVAGAVPFETRCAMLEGALGSLPGFSCSDIEGKRSGKSYSVHTLEQLQQDQPGADLFFIIGMDSFRDLPTWFEWRRLVDLAHLVVLCRPGFPEDRSHLSSVAIDPALCYDSEVDEIPCRSGKSVFFLKETRLDISSSDIRQRVADHRPITDLVPPAVNDFIRQNRLYLQE